MSTENEENQNNDVFKEEEFIDDHRRSKLIKVVALITAVCLIIMILTPLFKNLNLPPLNFLKESLELTQKSQIEKYQKSITTITAGDRKGTGFNIDKNGLIVTNAHVIQNAEKVTVSFYKGETYQGKVSKIYDDIDLAIIKVDGTDLPKLNLGVSSDIDKKEEVLIIGNPLNYSGIANKGKVYGKSKVSGIDKSVLLIDVPVNEGNSGSPIINENGEVVGVVFATVANNDENAQELGVAIPIEYLRDKLTEEKQ